MGRPKGSKNKPKLGVQSVSTASQGTIPVTPPLGKVPARCMAKVNRAKALEYRLAGKTAKQIAELMGVTRKRVEKWLAVSVASLTAQETHFTAHLVTLELTRLDQMFGQVYQNAQAGDTKAVAACLDIMRRRADLLGLDKKQTGTQIGFQVNMTAEQLAIEAGRLGIKLDQPVTPAVVQEKHVRGIEEESGPAIPWDDVTPAQIPYVPSVGFDWPVPVGQNSDGLPGCPGGESEVLPKLPPGGGDRLPADAPALPGGG